MGAKSEAEVPRGRDKLLRAIGSRNDFELGPHTSMPSFARSS